MRRTVARYKQEGFFAGIKQFINDHPVGRWFTNFVLILAIAGGTVWINHKNAKRDYDMRLAFCRDQETIRSYARATANRSLKSLPTLTYYKQHPVELKEALRLTREQRQFFSPQRDCKKFASELSE